MYRTLHLMAACLLLKGVCAVEKVVDLSDGCYVKLCYDVKTMGDYQSCKMKFSRGDQLKIFLSGEHVWSSADNEQPINLVVHARRNQVELIHILFKDIPENEFKSQYLYLGDDKFISIEGDLYYQIADTMRTMLRDFDLDNMSGEWFKSRSDGKHMVYEIQGDVLVGNVVQGETIIWANDSRCRVAAVRLLYNACDRPETCEIICQDKLHETVISFFSDDLGWHFVNKTKTPLSESKLLLSAEGYTVGKVPQEKAPIRGPDEAKVLVLGEQKGGKVIVNEGYQEEQEDRGTTDGKPVKLKKRQDVREIIESHSDTTVLLSLEDPAPQRLDYADIADYTICGMKTRVYNLFRAGVTHVTDGQHILWEKKPKHYINRVMISSYPEGTKVLLEISYYIRSDFDLGVAKGLKNKHFSNYHYLQYFNLIKNRGEWEVHDRASFVKIRDMMVMMYMRRHPELKFDCSFRDFFQEVATPPHNFKYRKNLWCDNLRTLVRTGLERLTKVYVPVFHDLKEKNKYLFHTVSKYVLPNMSLLIARVPYAVTRLSDGKQLIWAQQEDGIGVMEVVHSNFPQEELMDLYIDSKKERHKYYIKRNGWWDPVEFEEYMALLNRRSKDYFDARLEYADGVYKISTDKEEEKEDEFSEFEFEIKPRSKSV